MLKEVYDYLKGLGKHGIFFCFTGYISQTLLTDFGDILEKKMAKDNARKAMVLRVFYMVVEKAQNILRYSAEKIEIGDETLSFGLIAVGKENNTYFVLSGNMIPNNKVEKLKKRLIQIKSMSKEELKKLYKKQLKADPVQGSIGSGIGLIDIARKAGKPIEFDFERINDEISYFSIKTIL
ncbi:SiaB family protein kinase [Desulfobacterales bacterium HSG17]|nr:SiaB family protein kinase [Desulfobacterales bacterium HSG17]